MAEEPQPSNVKAGSTAAAAGDENPGLKPASKDDAKAAAALDSLDARGEDAADGKSASNADAAALSGAMSQLKVDGSKADTAAAAKKIKIDAKDVTFIVDQCDLKKDRATELLKKHDGDLKRALTAYVLNEA